MQMTAASSAERTVPIRLTNTLGGREEPFEPRHDPVTLYTCGMTPKFHPHVGHARLFVAIDVFRRYLEYRGYQVKHVQNFTDVDDKIIARGQQEGVDPREVARRYSESYFQTMDTLRVRRAHLYPTVTEFMLNIIAFVQGLEEMGYAYEAGGDVYYDVSAKQDYGKLSGRRDEGQLVGVRKELEPHKRNPRDFALWKRAKEGEPAWESPWGPGRPGWHIECSTMSRETLGDQLDLHAGGQDLIFPHHENEIAQSEALTGLVPFTHQWLHIALVTVGGEKMAHSTGNFTTVLDVLKQHEPMALRLYLINTHYRSPLAFNEESLVAAGRGLARLRAAAGGLPTATDAPAAPEWAAEARARFEESMDADFNTAGALGHLFDLSREINRRRDEGQDIVALQGAQRTLHELTDVLGLSLEAASDTGGQPIDPFVELVLDARRALRVAKQYAEADRLRDRLRALGIVVEDTAQGSVWRRARTGE
jgi:cysteinyl-tRNA synthetase